MSANMSESLWHIRRAGIMGVFTALLVLAVTAPAAAQITATYTGPNNGLWSDPANWDTPDAPINDGVNTYAVIIPNAVTVNFDIDGDSEITSLTLGDNARINFTGDRRLTTLDDAEIHGLIHATGPDAAYFAQSPLASFTPNGRGRAHALGGAAISILAPTYSGSFGGTGNWDVFIAIDAGSTLDLSTVASLALPNDGSALTRTFSVTASNGGVIDLSSVETIQGAGGNNWARFNILSGGQINLDSLQAVSGRTQFQIGVPAHELPALQSVTGASIFTVGSASVLDVPALTSMSGATLAIADGGEIEAPNLVSFTGGLIDLNPARTLVTPPFTEFDNSRVFISGGAAFDGVAASSYTFNPGGTSSWNVFESTDPGSLLDLSAVTSLSLPDAGYTLTRTFSITASNEGEIDFSNVTAIEGAGGNNWARFNILSGGQINLDAVQEISGRAWFRVESPMLELPSLSSITGASTLSVGSGSTLALPLITSLASATLQIDDGGTIDIPNLNTFTGSLLQVNPATTFVSQPIASFDNSRLFVTGGAVFDRVVASSYTFNPGGTLSWDVFLASGAGSVLDLSSLTSLALPDSGYTLTRTFSITASSGGYIDLSNVTNLQGAGGNNWARFNLLSGGQINLDSVQTMSGRVHFRVESPLFRLPLLQSVVHSTIFSVGAGSVIELPLVTSMANATLDIDDGGTIDAPMLSSFTNGLIHYTPWTMLVSQPFAEFDNSRVVITGGAVFDRVVAPGYTFNPGGTSSWDVFIVSNPGSVLDLSSLTSISLPDSGYTLTRNFTITASDGGLIDLSNVSAIQGPGGNNWGRFHIHSGGAMHFGNVAFAPGRTRFTMWDMDSHAEFLGSAAFMVPAEVSVSDGAAVAVARNLTFNHVDESLFRLDGALLHLNGFCNQRLEVGGEDLGMPKGPLPLNFQIGRLVIGDHDQPTNVELVDAIDNGNRGSKGEPEALYLQGLPEEAGLRILGGSTLYLNGKQVYALINDAWVNLNALVPKGEQEVVFDDGSINLGSFTCNFQCVPGDLNCDFVVDVLDLLMLLDAWGDCKDCSPGACIADLNGDCVVDVLDLLHLLDNWG
jgi:hypothetical protein